MKKLTHVLLFLSILNFARTLHADEMPEFDWACSVSTINEVGTTEKILNIEFIKKSQTTVTLYDSGELAIIFQQATNALDESNEYFIWIKSNTTGEELFRAYGEDTAAFGLKWLSHRIAAYCRPH